MARMSTRATDTSQKRIRRRAILTAARDAFAAQPFESVRMTEIARASGVAKGTLYLYYASKQALFLDLLQEELAAWFTDVDAALAKAPPEIDAVVVIVGDALARHPLLPRLLAIQHKVLETGVDYPNAFRFKTWLRARTVGTGARLESILRFLEPGEGLWLMLRIHAMVIGFEHAANPAPVVAQVLNAPGMGLFKLDFLHGFTTTLRGLLAGWSATRETTS